MTVSPCSHCGAPRRPSVAQCEYCGVHFADGGAAPAAIGIDREIEELVRRDDLVPAIKLHRERHKTSLREAKDAVQAIQRRLGS